MGGIATWPLPIWLWLFATKCNLAR